MDKYTYDFKVSFIVPAYNAEKYIEKCIRSILGQTHKNIEVIIVNDGSTDNTQNITEELAGEDSRIIVRNIENGGVSNARNIGISLSSGDYIAFVDADDYISEDYAEYMLGMAKTADAEFCLSKKCFTKKNEAQTENDRPCVLSSEAAAALLLSPEVIVGCWNKIFRRSFLTENNLSFCEDLFYGEGLYFIVTAALAAHRVAAGNRKVYYYRRNNEESATTRFNIEKLRNGEKALRKIKDNISVTDKKVETMWELHFKTFCLGAAVKINRNRMDKEYGADYKRYKSLLRRNLIELVSSKYVPPYRKALLLAGSISPSVIGRLDYYRRKRIAENSFSD